MKVPLIWLKDYVDITKSPKDVAASFTQLGLMLDKPIKEDYVLDLEHRMDRSDWLSILGCARDLAAFEDLKLKLPKLYGKPGKTLPANEQIKVVVSTPAVRRFETRVFKGIKVGPSPKWLVERLTAYGMESKNNIVDITNFVMVEYGQPLHAQDLAKLKGRDITIRPAKKGEKLTTLLGTEVKLDENVFVLTSGGEITVVGGIIGGKNTGVTTDTKDIVLDAGNYDSRVIRKTSRRLKIMNETVSRTDKFLDPRATSLALARATELILELAGGTYYDNDDYYPESVAPKTMSLRLSRLHLLSGMNISLAAAKKILKSLEYVVVEETADSLTVEIPYFRTDVEVEDDLVADILRIHNYTNIPLLPLSTPTPEDLTPPIYLFEEKLRNLLIAQGLHEHITSSLTTSNGESGQVALANALSADQNALRTNLEDGLRHVETTYKKHRIANRGIFEIGKVFRIQDNKYLEGRLLTALFEQNIAMTTSLATLLSSLGISTHRRTKKGEVWGGKNLIGTYTARSYTLATVALMPLVVGYTGIVSEFGHTTSLDLSLIAPAGVVYDDIVQLLQSIKGTWQSVICKNMMSRKEGNNYLLTLTWDAGNQSIETDKENILKSLKDKLHITSKS